DARGPDRRRRPRPGRLRLGVRRPVRGQARRPGRGREGRPRRLRRRHRALQRQAAAPRRRQAAARGPPARPRPRQAGRPRPRAPAGAQGGHDVHLPCRALGGHDLLRGLLEGTAADLHPPRGLHEAGVAAGLQAETV
ncbi:MAG: hypothetical protein AVDCRST_MAG30-3172, partial [uncultured Solirubrobacteraceae bacterium]